MTRAPRGAASCPQCGASTGRWQTYFCPDCGQHHDALYLAEAPDPRPRSREQIAREYRAVGMNEEADRLAGLPMSPPLSLPPTERPALSTEPTAFVQRSQLDLLESA